MDRKDLIEISPATIFGIVTLGFTVLLAASVLQDLFLYSVTPPLLDSKIWMFDVDVERSFYTWFSSIVLFSIGALLVLLGLRVKASGGRFALHWILLGIVFTLLSADESVAVHEKFSALLTRLLDTSGVFYFAWTIPAIFLVGAGFIFYLPMLMSLPLAIRAVMMASAAIYLTGAVGMELVAGGSVQTLGVETLSYRMMANFEEALEGLGLSIFLWCVLRLHFAPAPAWTLRSPVSGAGSPQQV